MLLVGKSQDKNYAAYLRHENEPPEFGAYKPSPEDEQELLASRHFLKRRVWRNMEKIRRSNRRLERRYKEPKKRIYRVRHGHVAA